MTFTIIAPNANQSPGLFPAQNNTNFQRLKDIINAEHNFTDSTATNQGVHKQVSYINRSDPAALPGINSILYAKADSLGASQLWFYNGANRYQLTPPNVVAPYKIVSTNLLISGTSVAVYNDPGFDYAGVAQIISTPSSFSYYYIVKINSVASVTRIAFSPTSPGPSNAAPTLSYTGLNLIANNNFVGPPDEVFVTSLILNRLN